MYYTGIIINNVTDIVVTSLSIGWNNRYMKDQKLATEHGQVQ